METKSQYINQQKYRKFIPKTDSYKTFPSSSFNNGFSNQNIFLNPTRSNNDLISTSADSHSYQNSNLIYEKPKIKDSIVVLRQPNEFVSELFKSFGENNCLCNFSLF
jgi:hypothetical protein